MKEVKKKPIQVLHIVGRMNTGGIETWLINVVKHLPSEGYRFDFFAISSEEGRLDEAVFALGCRFLRGSQKRPSVTSLLKDLRKVVSQNGPYDVIHSHVHHFSGIILLIGFLLRIPVRIAHSHTDTRSKENREGFLRRLYVELMRFCVRVFANRGIGVSSLAAEDQFGLDWKKDKRWVLLPCGIDLDQFDILQDNVVKEMLGIPGRAKVIGHVGRFDKPKNHMFLADVFKNLIDRGNDLFLVLVGEGPLMPDFRQRVSDLGLIDKVIFLGIRNDVPKILISVVDVFVFPSLYEGLGLAFVEAQLAGCYCVGSDVLPREVVVEPDQISLLSLRDPLEIWAGRIENYLERAPVKATRSPRRDQGSLYDFSTHVKKLIHCYRSIS